VELVGVAFSPDGRRLAAGGLGLLRVWEVGTWAQVLSRDDPAISAMWVGFGPDPDLLWTGPWSHAVRDGKPFPPRRWDLRARTDTDLEIPPFLAFPGFGLSPDGKILFVADTEKGVWVCDPATGRPKTDPVPQNP
jgi:WD40 repeat protein